MTTHDGGHCLIVQTSNLVDMQARMFLWSLNLIFCGIRLGADIYFFFLFFFFSFFFFVAFVQSQDERIQVNFLNAGSENLVAIEIFMQLARR